VISRLFDFEQNNVKPANSNEYARRKAKNMIVIVHRYLYVSLNVDGKTRNFNERVINVVR
jgi:hypothetical protein